MASNLRVVHYQPEFDDLIDLTISPGCNVLNKVLHNVCVQWY